MLPHTPVAITIPWRSDHGWREQVFATVFDMWVQIADREGWSVHVGVDASADPFNCARALNLAHASSVKREKAEVFVIASADHVPDPQAVKQALPAARSHGWAPIFGHTAGVTKTSTQALITGQMEPDDLPQHITATAPFCTALLAVRADVWDEIGGWDERFYGWGCEDTAFRLVLDTLYPNCPYQPTAMTYALWHEAASRDRFDANCALLGEYLATDNDADAMRALLARLHP